MRWLAKHVKSLMKASFVSIKALETCLYTNKDVSPDHFNHCMWPF